MDFSRKQKDFATKGVRDFLRVKCPWMDSIQDMIKQDRYGNYKVILIPETMILRQAALPSSNSRATIVVMAEGNKQSLIIVM